MGYLIINYNVPKYFSKIWNMKYNYYEGAAPPSKAPL